MKVFKVRNYGTEIEEKEAIRETDKFYILLGNLGREYKEAKSCSYEQYCLTREEAEQVILNRLNGMINSLLDQIDRATREKTEFLIKINQK